MTTAIIDWFRDMKYGIWNLWNFFRDVWYYRTWDYTYNLRIFRRGLQLQLNAILAYDNRVGKDEFVEQTRVALSTLDRIIEDSYGTECRYEAYSKDDNTEWLTCVYNALADEQKDWNDLGEFMKKYNHYWI